MKQSNRMALAAALVTALVGPASAQLKHVVPVSSLKAATNRQEVTPVPCNSVSACNQIIAYCAANSGRWIEGATNGQGQPTRGTCYLD